MTLPRGAPGRAVLIADLMRHSFAPSTRATRRIGAEVELLPLDAVSRCIVPLEGPRGAMLPLLRAFGTPRCWTEGRTEKGTPCFFLPGGGRITFEPGGQLEYSAPPARSVSALVRDLRGVLEPLRASASREGVDLVALGIEPHRDAACAPLQLRAERYERMDAYFDTIGPFGRRMMRQTASFQVCVDAAPGKEGAARWRVLNAAAPYVIAMFANSPRYAGTITPHASVRAECWRRLDPARTGVVGGGGERPTDAYLAFALMAPDMMRRRAGGEYVPFEEWLDAGDATLDDWHHHLSTLFPEVRPRGYVEVRGADAIDPAWCVAPLALLGAIAYEPGAQADALSLLSSADEELLERAGTAGLHDERIAATATQLVDIALRGCRTLGPDFIDSGDLDQARDFFELYTLRGRAPADDVRDAP